LDEAREIDGHPRSLLDTARNHEGLAYVEMLIDGRVPLPPMAALVNFRIVEARAGAVSLQAQPDERHYNPLGAVHGGWMATVLDSATGIAVHTTLPAGIGYTTVDLNVTYIRPVQAEAGPFTCVATVMSRGSRIATAEGRLEDATGKLFSRASATCLILPGWS